MVTFIRNDFLFDLSAECWEFLFLHWNYGGS